MLHIYSAYLLCSFSFVFSINFGIMFFYLLLMLYQGRRKQFLVGGGGARNQIAPTRHQQFWLILQNVLHIGNIQMMKLKYFKVPLPKEIFVTTSILSFPDIVWV